MIWMVAGVSFAGDDRSLYSWLIIFTYLTWVEQCYSQICVHWPQYAFYNVNNIELWQYEEQFMVMLK